MKYFRVWLYYYFKKALLQFLYEFCSLPNWKKKFGKIKKLKKIGKLQKNFIVPDLSCIICNGDMFPSTSFPAKIFLEKKEGKI